MGSALDIPRAVRDEFIDIASSSLSPETFDFLTLSDPAKSTRYSIDVVSDVFFNGFSCPRST